MKFSAVLLFAVAAAVTADRVATGQSRIVPELAPVSDEKFMKKDLPDDRRPRVYHRFDYPYPVVQDSKDYDEDYVEDKNDDGGYWSAQMKYDALKNKLTKEVDELKEALRLLQRRKLILDQVAKREKEAEKAAMKAEAEEKEADSHHDDATGKLKNAKQGVDGAADGVEAETMDLEECKKQLAAARQQLKDLLADKDSKGAEVAALEKKEAEAEAGEVGAEKDEEGAEKTVEEEKADVEKAVVLYKKELADVKVAEDNLSKQAKVVRKFRSAGVDPDGGVYEVKGKKSLMGGSQSVRLSLVALVATGAMLHFA